MKTQGHSHQFWSWTFAWSIIWRAAILFALINLACVALGLPGGLGKLTAYNWLFPGRLRLPYGDHPERAYNLSLYNLDALFASHELAAGPKPDGEYRVIVIGDSSTWGFLLPADQTFPAVLDGKGDTLDGGQQVRVYNLGYPVMSLTKDLLLLSHALQYQPDLIVWPLTLESFPYDKQLYPPLLQNNPEAVRRLISENHLSLNPQSNEFVETKTWQRTIIGQRRELADLLRLQLYGVMWAATGVDQDIPEKYTPREEDFENDASFHDLTPPSLEAGDLAFEILEAGVRMAGQTPILFINEPMFISQGRNSDIRYNFFYPRWAYDDYRQLLFSQCEEKGWDCLDSWDLVPGDEFTNSAVHLTRKGTEMFAEKVRSEILLLAGR